MKKIIRTTFAGSWIKITPWQVLGEYISHSTENAGSSLNCNNPLSTRQGAFAEILSSIPSLTFVDHIARELADTHSREERSKRRRHAGFARPTTAAKKGKQQQQQQQQQLQQQQNK